MANNKASIKRKRNEFQSGPFQVLQKASPYVVFSTRNTPDKDETASDSDKQKVAASPASTTNPPKAAYEQDDAILVSPLR